MRVWGVYSGISSLNYKEEVRVKEQIGMDAFTDDIPSEFTDEDKWFKFFTKPMLLVIAIGAVITVIVANIFKLFFGVIIPFLIIGFIATAVVVVMMMIPAPSSNVMRGGGESIMDVQLKKRYRKKSRCIWVKGISDDN